MRQYRTEAIILRRTNYGEADRILNFLTPKHGKITAIAKGVRRQQSKLAGGLELLAVSDVTILQGKSDIGVVTSARTKKFFGNILNDYDRLQLTYEIIKQINRAAETVSDEVFYDLLIECLEGLHNSFDVRLVELSFRLKLATLLGSGFNLLTAKGGEDLVAEGIYSYDFGDNLFYKTEIGRFGSEHIKLLRLATVQRLGFLCNLQGLDKVIDQCLWLARSV